MTALQPNAFAAGLRRALDIVRLREEVLRRDAEAVRKSAGACTESVAREQAAYAVGELIDALSDQLLDAGGFLGDAPEPEEMRATVRGWTVCYNEADSYAWFERDSDGTGGGLWFDNGALVDYDGVACLPAAVADAVRQLGLTVPADME